MKRIISLFLTIALMAAICAVGTVSANAAVRIDFYLYGDVDLDDDVTSVDVTLIQRHLAGMYEPSKAGRVAADFDHDREVSVIDVTWIQRELANMKVPEAYGGEFSDQNEITKFYGTYCSGKAIVGVPVTFTAEAITGTSVVDYTFTVTQDYNSEVLGCQSSSDDRFTFVFKQPGWYRVVVCCTDEINERNLSTRYHTEYIEVVKPYSIKDPVINNYYFDRVENGSELTVGAIGGTAPYQYRYTVEDYYRENRNYDKAIWKTDNENGGLTTGYIDSDTVPLLPISYYSYVITVTARDANGTESEPFIIDVPYLVEG